MLYVYTCYQHTGDVSDQSTHLSSGVHEYTDYYHSPQRKFMLSE